MVENFYISPHFTFHNNGRKMIKQFLKSHTSVGIYSMIRNVSQEITILHKHRKGVHLARKLHGQQHLRLNLGCGPKIKNGWINIDLADQADITLDLREPLPFLSNTCSIIYSEHFLNCSIDYPEQTQLLLKECYRVLEPGGLFSIGVPDTEWPIEEYAGLSNKEYFQIAKDRFHPAWCETEMEHINYHFRQGEEHRFAYDFKTLAKVLTSVGFQKVDRREFDPELDSVDRKLGTLYVNASKQETM
jgi:predicted SAM-dependent methyltransferase